MKTQRTSRSFLTRDEFHRLSRVNVTTELESHTQQAFLFSCLTGLRFSDLCLIKKTDYKEDGQHAQLSFVVAKTNEHLNIQLAAQARQIVRPYLEDDRKLYIFPIISETKEGDALFREIASRNAYFNRIIKVLANRASIDQSISFHSARHTFATLMLSNSTPLEVVGKLLGHESIKTTQVYAKVVDESKNKAIIALDGLLKKVDDTVQSDHEIFP